MGSVRLLLDGVAGKSVRDDVMLSTFARSQAALVLVGLLAISFCGCRSTTSKLASVPGMGWLAQDDEGWAGYEPPPDLPSATSSPTNAGSTSSIASTDSTRPGASGETARFDASRYGAKGFNKSTPDDANKPFDALNRNEGSTYGNYASAYGKYGPGGTADKSVDSRDLGTPQSGPYGGSSSLAASEAASPADQASSTETHPYSTVSSSASGSRFGDTSEAASAYTASRDSRFGRGSKPGESTWAADTKTTRTPSSSYTPPGFPKKPTATATAESGSLAGGASRFGAGEVSVPREGSATGSVIGDLANQSKQQVGDIAEQAKSRFSDASNTTIDKYSAAAQEKYENVTGTVNKQVDMISEYGKQMSQSIAEPVAQLAQDAQAKVSRFVGPAAGADGTNNLASQALDAARDRYGEVTSGPAAGAASGYLEAARKGLGGAHEVVNRYSNAVTDTADQETDAATGRYGEVAQDALSAAANRFPDAAQRAAEQSREVVRDYASAAADFVSGADSGSPGPASMPIRYPTTSTPNPYQLTPPSGDTMVRPPAVSSPASEPPAAAPATSPIRRSPAPWRPGGTRDLQGSNGRTTHKQLLGASEDLSGHLVLAVGDRYQFPRQLR